jgi:hypothetical protein
VPVQGTAGQQAVFILAADRRKGSAPIKPLNKE